MNLKTTESASNIPKLVKHVQENGCDVKVFDDQVVVGSITPIADSIEKEVYPKVECRDAKFEGSSQIREVYRTWGEELRGL